MKIQILKLIFLSNELLKSDIPKFRGYLAGKYHDYNIIHNHLKNGKFRYAYPLIQFKTIDKHPAIIGINEGIPVLQKVFTETDILKIGDKEEIIFEKSISFSEKEFGIADKFIKYWFVSPWLALNQTNYVKYKAIKKIDKERKKIWKKILTGNIISISKTLNYSVLETIKVDVSVNEIPVKLKGIDMTGFSGMFRTNFYLPDYIGLGKSVARGFGIIKLVKE